MTEPLDRNDPLSHPFLAELLSDKPPKELNSLVLTRYRNGVAAAMQLPEGEARQQVLNALNGGVHASQRVRLLTQEVTDLQEVLKTTQPDKSQMVRAIDVIGLHVKALHGAFKKVWDREKAEGRDPNKGAWAWFDHELHAGTDAIRYTARGLLIATPPLAVPDDAEGTVPAAAASPAAPSSG